MDLCSKKEVPFTLGEGIEIKVTIQLMENDKNLKRVNGSDIPYRGEKQAKSVTIYEVPTRLPNNGNLGRDKKNRNQETQLTNNYITAGKAVSSILENGNCDEDRKQNTQPNTNSSSPMLQGSVNAEGEKGKSIAEEEKRLKIWVERGKAEYMSEQGRELIATLRGRLGVEVRVEAEWVEVFAEDPILLVSAKAELLDFLGRVESNAYKVNREGVAKFLREDEGKRRLSYIAKDSRSVIGEAGWLRAGVPELVRHELILKQKLKVVLLEAKLEEMILQRAVEGCIHPLDPECNIVKECGSEVREKIKKIEEPDGNQNFLLTDGGNMRTMKRFAHVIYPDYEAGNSYKAMCCAQDLLDKVEGSLKALDEARCHSAAMPPIGLEKGYPISVAISSIFRAIHNVGKPLYLETVYIVIPSGDVNTFDKYRLEMQCRGAHLETVGKNNPLELLIFGTPDAIWETSRALDNLQTEICPQKDYSGDDYKKLGPSHLEDLLKLAEEYEMELTTEFVEDGILYSCGCRWKEFELELKHFMRNIDFKEKPPPEVEELPQKPSTSQIIPKSEFRWYRQNVDGKNWEEMSPEMEKIAEERFVEWAGMGIHDLEDADGPYTLDLDMMLWKRGEFVGQIRRRNIIDDTPILWTHDTLEDKAGYGFVELDIHSQEYKTILAEVMRTGGGQAMKKATIKRIESPLLFKQWVAEKERVQSAIDRPTGEQKTAAYSFPHPPKRRGKQSRARTRVNIQQASNTASQFVNWMTPNLFAQPQTMNPVLQGQSTTELGGFSDQILDLFSQSSVGSSASAAVRATPVARVLFHGTRPESVDAICREGFNRSFAGTAAGVAHGQGSYFATQAGYSVRFGNCMFVALVLTGRFAVGNPSMRVPPTLPNGERCESTVDNMGQPNMFVIYKDAAAYPAYLIEFGPQN